MTELLTYSKFYSLDEGQDLFKLLDSEGIKYKIVYEKNLLDPVYIGESLDPMILLKIKSEDFIKVNNVVLNKLPINLDEINADYHLLHFSVEELQSVVEHPAEWNYFDRALAFRLLGNKAALKAEHNNKIVVEIEYQATSIKTYWIVIQYFMSVIILWAGIIIGLATLAGYKVLPNGRKVNLYDDHTRFHARIILTLGILRLFGFFFWAYFIN